MCLIGEEFVMDQEALDREIMNVVYMMNVIERTRKKEIRRSYDYN